MSAQIARAERARDCDTVLTAMLNAWRQRGLVDANLAALPWTQEMKRRTVRDFRRVHELTDRWHRLYETKLSSCTRR